MITNQPYPRELESGRGENICNASSRNLFSYTDGTLKNPDSAKEIHEALTGLRDPSILDRPFSTLLFGANILDCIPRSGYRNMKI